MRSTTPTNSERKARSSLDQEVRLLTQMIDQFRIDSLRYFAGDLKVPPEELKNQISARIRKVRSAGVKGVADNFRMSSLEARFNSQLDLHNRKFRERERGGTRKNTAAKPDPDPMNGVVVGSQGDNNAVEVLYKGLYLSSGTRNPGMDLEKFRSYIDRQAAVVRSKTGCDNIQFRIAVEDGKMKIKAKPVK